MWAVWSGLIFFLKDYKFGFGGQFGIEYTAIDKAAESWDYYQEAPKHPSQIGNKNNFAILLLIPNLIALSKMILNMNDNELCNQSNCRRYMKETRHAKLKSVPKFQYLTY